MWPRDARPGGAFTFSLQLLKFLTSVPLWPIDAW